MLKEEKELRKYLRDCIDDKLWISAATKMITAFRRAVVEEAARETEAFAKGCDEGDDYCDRVTLVASIAAAIRKLR